MAELAKNVVERSVTIPGVQPKLSLSLLKDTLDDKAKGRLKIVGALGGNYIFNLLPILILRCRKMNTSQFELQKHSE